MAYYPVYRQAPTPAIFDPRFLDLYLQPVYQPIRTFARPHSYDCYGAIPYSYNWEAPVAPRPRTLLAALEAVLGLENSSNWCGKSRATLRNPLHHHNMLKNAACNETTNTASSKIPSEIKSAQGELQPSEASGIQEYSIALPKMDPSDITLDFDLDHNLLKLKASKKIEETQKTPYGKRSVVRHISVARSIPIPAGTKPEHIRADFADGRLKIKIGNSALEAPVVASANGRLPAITDNQTTEQLLSVESLPSQTVLQNASAPLVESPATSFAATVDTTSTNSTTFGNGDASVSDSDEE